MALTLEQLRDVYNRPEAAANRGNSIYAWGQDDQRTDQLAYNSFIEIMGREPSQDEFNQISPYFHGQGSSGQYTGRNYLNQLKQYEKQDVNNPLSPYNPQNPNNTLGQYSQPVNDVFQELLSRGASQSELDHFRQLLATGQADAFTLKNFVSQLPEYRNKQDTEFRSGLASELEGYDTSAFNKQKQDILSYYASQGMPAGTSPSLDYALTDLMGKIAEKRQGFLTGLSSEQYQGNKGAASSDYNRLLDQYYGGQNENRQRMFQNQDALSGRMFNNQDYQRQMTDYNNYMSNMNQNKPFNSRDWINLGMFGANTAAQAYRGGQGGGGGYGGGGWSTGFNNQFGNVGSGYY